MEFCFLHVYWWNWASQRWQPAGNTTATVTMVFVLSTLSDCTEMWRRVPLFCSTVDNCFKTSVQQQMLVWSGYSQLCFHRCLPFKFWCVFNLLHKFLRWIIFLKDNTKCPNMLTATWPASNEPFYYHFGTGLGFSKGMVLVCFALWNIWFG